MISCRPGKSAQHRLLGLRRVLGGLVAQARAGPGGGKPGSPPEPFILGRVTPLTSIAALRDACAQLPHSRETFPFDMTTLVFKVGQKMYALTDVQAEQLTVSVKVDPQHGPELIDLWPEIKPGYHLNKRHWITIDLNGNVPDGLILDLLRDSHALVVRGMTKAERVNLGL